MLKVLKLAILASLVSAPLAYGDRIEIAQCFTRTYSDKQLQQHPNQYAREFKFALATDKRGNLYGYAFLDHRNGGSWTANARCSVDPSERDSNDNIYSCAVDGNGGHYLLDFNPFAGVATFTVKGAVRLGTAGKADTLVIPEGSTNGVYKLLSAPISQCR